MIQKLTKISRILPILYKIIGVLLILGIITWWYNSTQDKIEELNKTVSKYELTSEISENTIKSLADHAIKQRVQLKELNTKLTKADIESTKLQNVIQKHDLQYLAFKKPKLIEKRINKASNEILNELQEISK